MSWIDEYMKILAKHEGTRPAKATEGGGYTRGYGITSLADNFVSTLLRNKGLNASEMEDKELAREYVIWNAEQISKQFDNYDEWPDSVKMAAVDLAYNGGNITRFKGFTTALREGRYQDAMSETLDVVAANDPETGKRGALRGLGNRRFDIYNYVARELEFPQITGLKVVKRGTGSLFSYTTADGATIDKAIGSPIHSASGKYDTLKKKTRPVDDITSPDDAMLDEVVKPQKPALDSAEPIARTPVEETVSSTVPPDVEARKGRVAKLTEAMFPERDKEVIQEDLVSPDDMMLETVTLPKGPEPQLPEGVPPPQEGSFEAMFGITSFGMEKAEDSFVTPDGYIPPQEIQNKITNFREVESNAQKLVEESQTQPSLIENTNPKYAERLPEPKELNEFQFLGSRRYGTVMQSTLGDDSFDYHMFTPTEGQAFGAAFRQYNIIPSMARMFDKSIANRAKYKKTPGYSAYNDDILKRMVGEDGLYFFRHSGSHEESMLKYRRMAQDRKDMETVKLSSSGTGYSVLAALTDPTILAPFFPSKIFKGGNYRVGRAMEGFGFGVLTTAPQQAVIESQNESRDATNAFLGVFAAGVLGGTIHTALGQSIAPSRIAQMRLQEDAFRTQMLGKESKYTAEQIKELKQVYAAGAQVSPEIARTNMYRQLEAEGLAETGIGIEKLGWNPTIRLFKSEMPLSRNIVPAMVDVGGLIQKKVLRGVEMEQSVETTFRTTYYPLVLDAVRASDSAYLRYRGKAVPQGEIGRAGAMMKARMEDIFSKGDGHLTEVQFRNRVGQAMARGDVDSIGDAASPFVTEAAKAYRKVFNKVKDEANKVRLFESELANDIAAATARGDAAAVTRLQEQLVKLREQGVTVNTAASYVPRIYRIDKIEQNIPRFLNIIKEWAIRTRRVNPSNADSFAAQVLDTVTRRRPFIDYESATDALDFVKLPSGVQARSLEIPDELIEEFLERDIESLMRTHVKTMGMDIELTRKFGSSSMDDVIKQITDEYQRLIGETKDFTRRGKLAEGLENDLRDIRGLRDRLRGTYGASKDPHQLSSRFVRVMKSFNVLTGMGSAMVSSVPDIARIAMVEGFSNAYSRGFATLFNEQAAIIRTMSKPELNKAAIGVDAALGLRAHAMSDMGDLFGNRYTIERTLNDATGMFFLMNGLNIWNQVLKEIAGNVTMLRMTESIMAKNGWQSLTDAQRQKLLKNGISRQDYGIMRMNIETHGQKVGNEWLPNTDAWTDVTQRLRFRNALNQNVERIIITPGAGDRALWTSTEFGSLLTQFKSYGQGAMQRMFTSGLQEKDGAFWQGAFLIVGLAAMVNEIKRAQYGLTSNESFDQKLINAVDRSGLLGWFTDVNNGIEKLSDYQLGMRPLLTDQQQYPVHTTAKASAVTGPTSSAILNALSVAGDTITGNVSNQTAQDLRFIFPSGNLFYLDPIYDGVFGEGNVNRQPEANRR